MSSYRLTPPPVDITAYQHRKLLAKGMMDIALLSANSSQLNYLLTLPSEKKNGYFFVSMGFIISSVILQIVVGVGLIWNGRYDVNNLAEKDIADRSNNCLLIGIFFITVINILTPAFAV